MAAAATYRLTALLHIREKAKDDAQRYLGSCNAELKKEQDRQREMEQELERLIAKRESKKLEYAEKAMRG